MNFSEVWFSILDKRNILYAYFLLSDYELEVPLGLRDSVLIVVQFEI